MTTATVDAPTRSRWALAASSAEGIWTVAVLALATRPWIGYLHPREEPFPTIWLGVYAVAAVLIAVRPRAAWATVRSQPAVVLLVALAWASLTWTTLPAHTLGGSIDLTGTTVIAVWLASRWSPLQLTAATAVALAVGSAASLAEIAAGVERAVETEGREAGWMGVWTHRNEAAVRAATGLVACLVLAGLSRRWLVPALVGAAACAVLVVGTGSATPPFQVAAGAVLAAVALLRRGWLHGGRVRQAAVAGAVALGAALVTAVAQLPAVLELLGRSPQLTGRTRLWAVMAEQITERPWLGWGYNAFWSGTHGPSAPTWFAFEDWDPAHGHNGFIDVVAELGVVGLALVLVVLGVFAWQALRRAWASPTVAAWAPLIVVATLLTGLLGHSPLLRHNLIFWLLPAALALRQAAEAGGRLPRARPASPEP